MVSELAQRVSFRPTLDRPNPFSANLGTLFHGYTRRFLLLTEQKLTAHRVQVDYRLSLANVAAQ